MMSAAQSAENDSIQDEESDVIDVINEKVETVHTSSEEHNVLERDRNLCEMKRKACEGYVGFSDLPNQIYRKAIKNGFDFTLMVVGESGLGKSTLINSMFLADIYAAGQSGPCQANRPNKTVRVETNRMVLRENCVNLTLTLVDTPGFGDAIDNSNCWQPIVDYIDTKYDEYLDEESMVTRKMQMLDPRVHCCLYFIAPTGHGLKPLDVEFMQRLYHKVNIIPVIGKADTMTPEECSRFKKRILQDMSEHKIQMYDFPDVEEEDSDNNGCDEKLKDRIPLAVAGSNTIVERGGKKIRGREYPWGVVEIDNLEHCDFVALRNMLIRTHLHDLKDVTNCVHYENYRSGKLVRLCRNPSSSNEHPIVQMKEDMRERMGKLVKMESEIEQAFELKVEQEKKKLLEPEVELLVLHEEAKKGLQTKLKQLVTSRENLEAEKSLMNKPIVVRIDELRKRNSKGTS